VLSGSPPRGTPGRRTVTQWLSSSAHLAVHDPGDTLGRPRDTHELQVNVKDVDEPGTIHVSSFDCGPHDTARTPQELGCPLVGSDVVVVGAASASLRNRSVRWRAATDAGALRLRLDGGSTRQWLHRPRAPRAAS